MRRVAAALISVAVLVGASGAPATAGRAIAPVVLTAAAPVGHRVALTFDDGPSPYTPALLVELKRYRVRATFFVVGQNVPLYRGVVRAEALAGNQIGNHTDSHANLQWLDGDSAARQLDLTQRAVMDTTGHAPRWFRPPYGAVDTRVAAVAAANGLRTVTWSVDPRDWTMPGVDAIVARVLDAVRSGSVILLHDGGGDRSETVAAVAQLVPLLRARGYRFVTVDRLFFPRPRPRPPARHYAGVTGTSKAKRRTPATAVPRKPTPPATPTSGRPPHD